jgi:hypothetical protein
MRDRATVGAPLEIARIESSRADGDTVALRLSGRWLDPAQAEEEELLVVQVQGRRHRFPAIRDPQSPGSEGWSASFTLPDWAEPRHDGQAALWLGSSVIPVPPAGSAPAPVAERVVERPAALAAERLPPHEVEPPTPPSPAPSVPDAETPRSGPLADLLLKETVAALHAELEQRTAETVRLRGSLADARSEVESRSASQAALEATQQELRVQLERLTAGVQRHRAELDAARDQRAGEAAALREQLAAAQALADRRGAEATRLREDLAAAKVVRDAALSEVAGLRAELQRAGAELAATRERVAAESGDLGEAQRLLAEARELSQQLRDG